MFRNFNRIWNEDGRKLRKVDYVILAILMVVYGLLSFYQLGSTTNPQTFFKQNGLENEVVIALQDDATDITKVRYFIGEETGNYRFSYSEDGINYTDIDTVVDPYVFSWNDLNIGAKLKYLKVTLTSDSGNAQLGEMQLYDRYGYLLPSVSVSDGSGLVLDEVDLVPSQISYMNSTYFDEIYFARTAYEYANGLTAYEWVHPPLGKVIQMLPIAVFGMNPLSYRLMGNIAGILMIPVLYILAKNMFQKRKYAIVAGLLMALDTFHFAQSRMGTADTFLVLFIMLSFLFFYQYLILDRNTKLSRRLVKLFLSGLFVGLSIATKWTGLFAGVAMAILFFVHYFKYYVSFPKDLAKEEKRKKWLKRGIIGVIFLILIPIGCYFGIQAFIDSDYFLGNLATQDHWISHLLTSENIHQTLTIVYLILAVIVMLITTMIRYAKNRFEAIWMLLVCLGSFILLPLTIYIGLYFLFPNIVPYQITSLEALWNQTQAVYQYHANLQATHPFTSPWYTWSIMLKPVWYYVGYYTGGVKATISGIGNPVIWWVGAFSLIFLIYDIIKNKKKETFFLIVVILSMWLPYAFIGRVMFLYHFFPVLPFMMLSIVRLLQYVTEKWKTDKVIYTYLLLVLIGFALFYPIASGRMMPQEYIEFMKWLPTWTF